jgi:hypothetical protein
MKQKAVIMFIALFLVIVIGMFVFAYLKNAELVKTQIIEPAQTETGEVKYASITRITAKHYFEDGLHTFAGEIPMPTPCDLLDTSTRVAESFPEQVFIDFKVINNSEACIQQITTQRFKVSAQASVDATISATFEGREVELNLVPAGEGETPDDFELFIKG